MTAYKRLGIVLAALLVLLAFINIDSGMTLGNEKPGKTAHVPDVLLLKVQPGVTLENNPGGGANHKFSTNSPALEEALASIGVQSVKPVFPAGQAKKDDSLSRIYRLKLKPKTDLQAAMTRLASVPDVSYAEPDYIAVRAEMPSSHRTLTIDDPLYSAQWGMTKINIEGAWDDTYGSPTVTIAILDSGIDLTHVDLAAHLWLNPGEIAGNGLDDDSNGYIDDVNGWNFVAASNDLWDDNGHGTLTAGVAAAIGGNTQGIAGVCPECTILPVKVMQSSGVSNYSDVAAGVLYAAQKGAKVINLSLGGYANSNTLRNAINTAVDTYGVVVVAGAGNDNLSTPFYPAAYSNVLAVAGTAADDMKLNFSNYGSWVDVSAPAVDIRTTALGGDWANGSGTSVSSPFAAGLAGLLRALHPEWNQATIRSQIAHTTDSIESLNPTYAGQLGTGRLNAGAAMMAPHPILSMSGYAVNGTTNGRPVLGVSANLVLTLNNDWWDATGVTGTLSTLDTYVTITNGTASFGDINAAASGSNATPFTFTVDAGAGPNHPIDFTLDITETGGYTNTLNFTVTTESRIVSLYGTIQIDTTWTNDNTYLLTANVNVPLNVTLIIQPGTTIKFDSDVSLNVRGTLIADGTVSQPIHFMPNTEGVTWNNILFDDSSVDAVADGSGVYTSGSILRYVTIEGTTGGIDCNTSTPYLAHISLGKGGIVCSLGATPLWFMDNNIFGGASFTGAGNAYRNTVSGNLGISGAGEVEDNTVNGNLSLGSGNARRNSTSGGGLSVGGSGGTIENNTVYGGSMSAGTTFQVLNNTVGGSLTAGSGSTVDHNTVFDGMTVGSSSTVTWNNVENGSGVGLTAGDGVTAQYNRLVGNGTGMVATTGTIEHNLFANNTGVGLQVGAATVQYNTFTGNKGNAIVVQGGTPVTIAYNNLEGNTGSYDLYLNIPYIPSDVPVMAQHNWWGTTIDTEIAWRVYDWYHDDTKAKADYASILTEPDPTAPGYVRNVTVADTVGIETATFQVQFSRPMDTNQSPQLEFYNSIRGSWTQYNSSNSLVPSIPIKFIAIDGNGTKWLNARWTGVVSFDGTQWNLHSGANGSPDNYVISGAAENNGTVWIGTQGSGVYSFDGIQWRRYDPSNSGLGDAYVYKIGIGSNGTKWFVSNYIRNICLSSFDGATWHVYTPSNSGYPANGISSIAVESNGTVWMGTDSGVYSFDGTTWRTYDPSNSGAPGGVNAIAIDDNDTKWFGTGSGVYSFDGTTWRVYNTSNSGLPNNSVAAIAIESNGTKWFATGSLGVTRFDGIAWRTYTSSNSGLPGNGVLKIAIESNGTKWFGTYDGMGVLNEAEQYIINDSLHWQSSDQFSASHDITSIVPKATYRVNVSNAIDTDGMRVAPVANTTFNVDYAGFISDKTPPLQPTVTASGDGSLTTLSASWFSNDPESPITKYRYAIGTTPGGRDVVAWKYTDDTFMTHTGLNLTSGVTYYVSVGARNEGGLWSESGVSNGIIAGSAPPGTFGKSTPPNNSLNRPLNPTLSWAASTDTTEYLYCLDKETTNNSTCDSSWVSILTATSVPLSGLDPNSIYYWQVRATGSGGTTDADSGTWWKFTTIAPPASFGKSTPANDSLNRPLNPSLSWSVSTDTTEYLYCLDKETTNNSTCDSSWISALTATSVPLSGLDPNSTYYWQVRATGGGGTAEADSGTWWKFKTRALPAVFYSGAAQDGWVLESTETSNVGGALDAASTVLQLGDEAGDKQYRSILLFNTAILPDNAVITKVTLKIKKQGLVGTDPFSILGALRVDVRMPYFGTSAGLVASDFQALVSRVWVGTFVNAPVSNWYSAVIASAGHPYINKAGPTQFRLYFAKDDNDDGGADYMKFFSGNYATAGVRPTLVIQYYLP